MNLEHLCHLIHLLRSSYIPGFEFQKEVYFNTLFDQKSLIFEKISETDSSRLTLPDLIQNLTAALGQNDRYLEVNTSGDWTTVLAAILHDRPVQSCVIQASKSNELSLDDPRILNLPEVYLEYINFLEMEPEITLSTLLMELQESEPEIQNTIVLLPMVENYRLHFLNLLTIVPFLGESALVLAQGAHYPWIKLANQDFLNLYSQVTLILDLSLYNSRLGDRLGGMQILGIGPYWVDFYENNIDFNPHFLKHLQAHSQNDRSLCLGIDQALSYEQTTQQILQDAVRYHQAGDRDRAKLLYNQVLQQDLNQDLAWGNLGTIAFEEDDRDLALQLTYIASAINPENDLHWRNLGLYYHRSRDFKQSIYFFRKALETNDKVSINYLNLAKSLEQSNQFEMACFILQQGYDQFPTFLSLYIKRLLLKPLIYKDSEEIKFFHNRIIQHLQEIEEYLQRKTDNLNLLDSRQQLHEIFEAIDLAYFAYQGLDLITIAKKIANIINAILDITQPTLRELLPSATNSYVQKDKIEQDQHHSKKIRVGYVGTCLRDHVVGYLSRGWIQYHDRSQFEVFCYSINPHYSSEDSIAATFEHYSDRFYCFSLGDFRVLEQILSDRLDILVFLDLNVGTSISYYALLRLAPVQCGFWGNPMTSGSPQIDYFLSSQFMESWNAQNHYTEQLVYLPQLASALIPETIDFAAVTSDDFGLNPERVTYLFTQTLLKHLPQHDYIFAEIAQRVPQSEFIFLAQPDEYLAQAFFDRLDIRFSERNLNISQYCRILPVMPKPKFYALQSLVNVALDSLGWSGGVTTLDAVNCNLPVVTYPGTFMRGRHSYGILQLIGVTETIAHSEQEYIDIAVQLGLNREWNTQVRTKIKQNQYKLYSTQSCVSGLENFYHHVYLNPCKLKNS